LPPWSRPASCAGLAFGDDEGFFFVGINCGFFEKGISMAGPGVVNRRRFLKSTLGGLGAAALALPAIGGSPLGAAERIHFGVIGCGGDHCGRGTDHLQNLVNRSKKNETGATGNNVDVIGICDIYERHKRQAKEIAPAAEVYHDFRKLLERKDLDAV